MTYSSSCEDDCDVAFNKASAYLPEIMAKMSVDSDHLLYLYARFKQATVGPCDTKRPGFLEFQLRKKWDAWKSLKEMSQEEAKAQYVQRIMLLDPSWHPSNNKGQTNRSGEFGKLFAIIEMYRYVIETNR